MFGHPNQHAHMFMGRTAAAKSKKTPAHLRGHQQRLSTQKPGKAQSLVAATPTIAKGQFKPSPKSSGPKRQPSVAPFDPFYGG